MQLFRNLLLIYAFGALLISGGLMFNQLNKAYRYLGVFILIFAIEAMDFLYITSSLPELYPDLYMMFYPICLFAGPMLLFHLKSLDAQYETSIKNRFWHYLPFLLFLGFTAYLMTYRGAERIAYSDSIYTSVIQPLNYLKSVHVLFYACLIVRLFLQKKAVLTSEKRQYFLVLTLLYSVTAVSVTLLTALMVPYTYFIVYFMTSAILTSVVGYILYFKPDLLHGIRKKYAHSNLGKEVKDGIILKMQNYFDTTENLLNPKVSLQDLSFAINEKKHHISQVLSDEMKTNFNDFVNEKRVRHAQRILSNAKKSDLKILAVALESGFTNKSTFYRSFLKFAKCSPSEYRSQKLVPNN